MRKNSEQSSSSDKTEWLKNHTLSVEQFQQLIQNKYERAKKDHENLNKLKTLVKFKWLAVLKGSNEDYATHSNKLQTGGQ